MAALGQKRPDPMNLIEVSFWVKMSHLGHGPLIGCHWPVYRADVASLSCELAKVNRFRHLMLYR